MNEEVANLIQACISMSSMENAPSNADEDVFGATQISVGHDSFLLDIRALNNQLTIDIPTFGNLLKNAMAESDNESGGQTGNTSGNNEFSGCREQDRFLPIANVSRIMKKALPANAKISKEAKETVQECVSEFISFITGEASDKCQKEKRKTINGDDLLWAMTTLGFEEYVEPLKIYLHKYREMEGEKTAMMGRPQSDLRDGNVADGYSHPGSMIIMMGHQHQHQHQPHVYGSGTGSPSSARTR
ncbi:hypothetical protein VNO77_25365 [Canavalia gladiata]|uniref:Transcription factor CBF/NF-Y/archaeal histone domain-containing protein n=1 Tax=Canavalia gladiata TaxID=3824 RepID=A0AAN9LD54_CANGL